MFVFLYQTKYRLPNTRKRITEWPENTMHWTTEKKLVCFPAKTKDFPNFQSVETGCGTYLAPYSSGTHLAPYSNGTHLAPYSNGTHLAPYSNGAHLAPYSNGTRLAPYSNGTHLTPYSNGTHLAPYSNWYRGLFPLG